MIKRVVNVPDLVRRSNESRGPAGRAWLAALPGIVDELCRAWSLDLGEVLDGGKWAYVVRARTAEGTDAVLKVAPPTPEFGQQIATIAAAEGRGYVRLFEADPARSALLMEPLGPPLSAVEQPVEQVLDVLAAMLRSAWRIPVPTEAATAHDAGSGRAHGLIGLIDELWPLLAEPCSGRLIALVRGLAERRAADANPARSVVCHGDPHAANALAVLTPRPGAATGYVFVDPDGFLGDPAYDLAVAMRGWPQEVLSAGGPVSLTRTWSARLAAATDVDERRIWEWALIERVTTGLYLTRHGHQAEGRLYLDSAERLVSR